MVFFLFGLRSSWPTAGKFVVGLAGACNHTASWTTECQKKKLLSACSGNYQYLYVITEKLIYVQAFAAVPYKVMLIWDSRNLIIDQLWSLSIDQRTEHPSVPFCTVLFIVSALLYCLPCPYHAEIQA